MAVPSGSGPATSAGFPALVLASFDVRRLAEAVREGKGAGWPPSQRRAEPWSMMDCQGRNSSSDPLNGALRCLDADVSAFLAEARENGRPPSQSLQRLRSFREDLGRLCEALL